MEASRHEEGFVWRTGCAAISSENIGRLGASSLKWIVT